MQRGLRHGHSCAILSLWLVERERWVQIPSEMRLTRTEVWEPASGQAAGLQFNIFCPVQTLIMQILADYRDLQYA